MHKPSHQDGEIIHGRYQIVSFIARGGFGETYIVKDMQSQGLIRLLKYLKPMSNSPQVLEIAKKKFCQEAEILDRLGKGNQQIPKLHNFFQENQKFYLVQEYINGQNLEDELKTKIFSEVEAIEILYNVLKILNYLSEEDVIHRDIKPANLIRRNYDNKIFLIDFGAVKEISTLLVNSQGLPVSTTVIGTPGYMPQEQQEGNPKFASDIYALGITTFKLLTGKILQKNPEDQIIWDGLQVNPHFAKILDKMVCHNYQKRYQTATDVLADLEPLTMLGKTLNQRYSIQSYLGGVGFCHAYLASDIQHPYQPSCILKQIKLRGNNQQILQSAQSRFATAVTTLEQLSHKQIPRLCDRFQKDREFYLVYEFIEGSNLNTRIAGGDRLSEQEVIDLLKNVLEVLSFIHQHNVIHGDIKPSNLIHRKQDNKFVLIDFSEFKQISTLDINSQRIIVKPGGTDGYMPPEQLQNRLQHSSDIYALGMTAIQALTGVLPSDLQTDSHGEVVWQNQTKISRKLARILTKMVRFHIRQRYQSAQKVLEDLNTLNNIRWRKFAKAKPILVVLGIAIVGANIIHIILQNLKAEELVKKGKELANNQQYRLAIYAFNEAIDIDSKYTDAWVNKGYAYGKLGDFDKQLSDCQKAIGFEAEFSGGWLCSGNAKKAKEQYEESIEDYEKAITLACSPGIQREIARDCAAAFNNKGESLLKLSRLDDALQAFQEAIDRGSGLEDVHVFWTNKGEVLLKKYSLEVNKSFLQSALSAFKQALVYKKEHQPAKDGEQRTLRLMGK